MIDDALQMVANHAYGEGGVPHDVWTRLRAESPVAWCETEAFEPFWAITKHADICEVSKQPDRFSSEPGIVLLTAAQQRSLTDAENPFSQIRQIITMDPPEHREYRKVASPVFTPRAVKDLDDVIDASARRIVDELAGESGEGECDFANDVAAAHPLRILCTMLGLDEDQEHDLLRLTNELFGLDDPDLQRAGDDRNQAILELGMEFVSMFNAVIEDRRACPTGDLASLLANAEVNGCPMGMMETIGYYLITFTAGHDTTKNALAGGMQAFIDNPDQLALLRDRPELADSAVEEVIRWTSPVNYMKRTATEDCELRGQKIRAGDSLVLFYASGNRDEDVFDDPFSFRIERSPNRHVGFGFAEHFCLGANLARRSQRALWLELLSRLESIESTGPAEQIHSAFVVGLKKLPVRYRIRPARVAA